MTVERINLSTTASTEINNNKNNNNTKTPTTHVQTSLKRFFPPCKDDIIGAKDTKRLKKPCTTLHIYEPSLLEVWKDEIPCTLHLHVLDKELVQDLIKWCQNSNKENPWPRHHFRLFDRAVTAPHQSVIFMDDSVLEENSPWSKKGCLYHGQPIKGRPFFEALKEARKQISQVTQAEMNKRSRERERNALEIATPWWPNVCVINRYTGGDEQVGWHSDQLTYLGVLPTIASLTLGPTRPFLLKNLTSGAQTAIHLPHNSLLIMHPPCQEAFTHSVPPYRNLQPSSSDLHHVRLNFTFRMWRPEYVEQLPLCDCGKSMVLRRLRPICDVHDVTSPKTAGWAWMCQMGADKQGKSCDKFVRLNELDWSLRAT